MCHGLLALGMLPTILGARSQSPRELFASCSPPLAQKGQQEPPKTCGGPSSPKATSKWPFVPVLGHQVQTTERFLFPLCLVAAKHSYSVPAAKLELQSSHVTLPLELGPTLTPLI